MRTLMWFREDLRIRDNTALYQASKLATRGIVAIYIACLEDWERHDIAACRVDFILRNLQSLSDSLQKLNIPLLFYQIDKTTDMLAVIEKIITAYQIDALFFNYQYEIDELRRDNAIIKHFKHIQVNGYHDQTIIVPGEILTKNGNYYTVFTPFKKAWLAQVNNPAVLPIPSPQAKLFVNPDKIPSQIKGYTSAVPSALWPAGETYAQQKLDAFIKNKLSTYETQRDFPSVDGTSKLSPYLAIGAISARQCFKAAQGDNSWVNELIWREFYKHILAVFPRISMHQSFKTETKNLIWDNNPEWFTAWCQGKTGYPIIDAGMRQLIQTGWMHNRLRMITAMFLVKDLGIDWRWGEKFFMQHLIDGDLAANNGGWQWSASTGTDAVPYFRIFNPWTQSRKFDPQGVFIKKFCPELEGLSADDIHEPHLLPPLFRSQLNYPEPLVEHSIARIKTLERYKRLQAT